MEEEDLTADFSYTKANEHCWGHPGKACETHAHLFDEQGALIAKLQGNLPVREVLEVHPDGGLFYVAIQEIWFESSGVTILEKYYQP